jgi:hypothetical protein
MRAQLEASACVAVMGYQRRVRAAMRDFVAPHVGAATTATAATTTTTTITTANLSVRTAVRAACRGLRASMDGLRARTPGGFALYALGYDAMLAAAGQLAVMGAWAGAIPATQALQRLVYALVIGDALHVYAPFAGVRAHVWRMGGPLACGEPQPAPDGAGVDALEFDVVFRKFDKFGSHDGSRRGRPVRVVRWSIALPQGIEQAVE